VICQSMTFRLQPILFIFGGRQSVFIDSEPETWNLCPVALEIAIIDRIAKGKNTKSNSCRFIRCSYKIEE
jgi:dTDP-4-amino-4,6-dideoxygalactose transaminase